MTRGTFEKSIESSEYDFVKDKAQRETIELLANTLIEVRKHMTAHIPEKIFDLVDDTLIKSGFGNKINSYENYTLFMESHQPLF